MARRSDSIVFLLSGSRLMSRDAFSSDTSTDSTPSIFLTATLTAWAQYAQSIPSTLIRTLRSSARAGAASAVTTSIAALIRLPAVEFLVNRKQHAPFQAVSLVEQQDRRPDQHHPAAAVGNLLRSVSRA